jgi:hypothetical protein
MAIIHTYPVQSNPESGDLLIGSDATGKQTKNFTVESIKNTSISGTVNKIPLFTGANVIGDSVITQNSNNIGIGTTSPSANLEVSSGVGANGDSILTISADTDNSTSSSSPKLLMLQKGSTKISLIEMDSSNKTHFSNGDGYYFSGGNVGIGTTSPQADLDVNGVIMCSARLELTTNGRGIVLKSPDGTAYRITVDNGGSLVVTAV